MVSDNFFFDKVLIVFGGANGIGKGVVEVFARKQAKVFFCDKDAVAGSALQASLNQLGFHSFFYKCDVSVEESIQSAINTCSEMHSRIDFIFNSAAVASYPKFTHEYIKEEIMLAFSTNVFSIIHIAQKIMPIFIKQKFGVMINCSSMSAHKFKQQQSLYSATKAATVALTKSMALDYAAQNIRVHCISPADADTPMLQRRANYLSVDKLQFAKNRPIQRLTSPEEIGEVVAFLCSPAANTMTGLDLDMSGGRQLW